MIGEPSTSSATFDKNVARKVVRKINDNVEVLIKDSKLVDKNYYEKDEQFGLFTKSELQLGELLGSGGFSDIYEIRGFKCACEKKFAPREILQRQRLEKQAVDSKGNSKFVVKHLKSKLAEDTSKFALSAADLIIEAHLLTILNHKNILSIWGWSWMGAFAYSSGDHDGYFLVLDRLYDTLDKRIEKWRSIKNEDLRIPTQIVQQVALGLEYLHSKNIVFRDVKPENVGFDKDGIVKIFDFGLARELPNKKFSMSDAYHMTGKVGTLRYMAPECARSKQYNQKVDSYSLALLFWNCLTLNRPYDGMSRSDHKQKVCFRAARPQLDDSWPESIRKLLKKSWAPSLRTRLTMSKICTELEQIQTELRQDQILKESGRISNFVSSTTTRTRGILIDNSSALKMLSSTNLC
mmetsp:Transcript_26033/g.38479  ORF Transcript_26033/g.38479 Transcript_26033/m.38479 type:complete len:407 (-) Transcript_26033:116-1336(-)